MGTNKTLHPSCFNHHNFRKKRKVGSDNDMKDYYQWRLHIVVALMNYTS